MWRTAYFAVAIAVFLSLWPLQMYHWLGESFMNRGMQIKDRIDRIEMNGWPYWPIRGDDYYRLTIEDLYPKVYEVFDKSIAFYPFYMETYYIVGRYYIDGGSYDLQDGRVDTDRFKRGRDVLLQDIHMNPNYKWAHNNLGVIYDKLSQVASLRGNYRLSDLYRDLARKHYEVALDIDSKQIFALFNLGNGYWREGMAYQRMGEAESASPLLALSRDYMERCIEVQPGKVDCYDFLSQILLVQRDYVGLVHYLEGLFALLERQRRPVDDQVYHRTLASGYLKADDPIPANRAARPEGPVGEGAPPLTPKERGERALRLLAEARRLIEKEGEKAGPELARQLADAYLLVGDYEQAAEEYRRMMEAGIRDAIVFLDLARLSVKANRYDDARGYVRQALTDPADPERMYRLLMSDATLDPITRTPWFEDLAALLGFGEPRPATGEVAPGT